LGKFDIPPTGQSGTFSFGSGDLGLEGFIGGFTGTFDSAGKLFGKSFSAGLAFGGPIGVGGEVVFDDSGSEIGRAASLGAGGGG